MKDAPDERVPRQGRRAPDSIWERYLTGKLSLEDKETLPGLVKELHLEIAQHLEHKTDAHKPNDVAPLACNSPSPPAPGRVPIIDINVRRSQLGKRRRIDPKQN